MDEKQKIYERMAAEGCDTLPDPTMLWAYSIEELLLLEQNFLLRELIRKTMGELR
jgi:hypothetical protein